MLSPQIQIQLEAFEIELQAVANALSYPQRLREAVAYSLLAGGKRIRPLLSLAVAQAFGLAPTSVYPLAVAIEMIHTYSLIHDDLPAMDDDDLRRGVPTNHIVYGEALAILAGDALLSESFQQLTRLDVPAALIIQLVSELSHCAGGSGMVGGQVLDLAAESIQVTLDELATIHDLKTGKMIEIAVVGAALIANATELQLQHLRNYTHAIGLAFQIQDDILDVVGTTAQLGKPQGSDVANAKSTYVSLLGIEGAKAALAHEYTRACDALTMAELATPMLLELTQLICIRQT